MPHPKGFTLIELMIVVVVVAVLAAIAIPGYQQFTLKSKRGDAMNSLLQAQILQERWRADHTAYAALADIWTRTGAGGTLVSLDGYYRLSDAPEVLAGGPTGAAYAMKAEPVGGQARDKCGTFVITQNGPVTSSPWADSNCWGR
ncbi:MAG: type IV pilin protein [Haliea sp.]